MLAHEQGPEEEFQANIRRLDALVQEFEALPYPQIREKVFELLQTIDTVHRAAIERLAGFLQAQRQAGLIEQAAEDPLIRSVAQAAAQTIWEIDQIVRSAGTF